MQLTLIAARHVRPRARIRGAAVWRETRASLRHSRKTHSGWMHVRATFTGDSDHEILEETERGEDRSVKTYREALGRDLPQDLRSIVRTQFEQVQEAQNNIRRLRDETCKTT